jgi:hypothetical protein
MFSRLTLALLASSPILSVVMRRAFLSISLEPGVNYSSSSPHYPGVIVEKRSAKSKRALVALALVSVAVGQNGVAPQCLHNGGDQETDRLPETRAPAQRQLHHHMRAGGNEYSLHFTPSGSGFALGGLGEGPP